MRGGLLYPCDFSTNLSSVEEVDTMVPGGLQTSYIKVNGVKSQTGSRDSLLDNISLLSTSIGQPTTCSRQSTRISNIKILKKRLVQAYRGRKRTLSNQLDLGDETPVARKVSHWLRSTLVSWMLLTMSLGSKTDRTAMSSEVNLDM